VFQAKPTGSSTQKREKRVREKEMMHIPYPASTTSERKEEEERERKERKAVPE